MRSTTQALLLTFAHIDWLHHIGEPFTHSDWDRVSGWPKAARQINSVAWANSKLRASGDLSSALLVRDRGLYRTWNPRALEIETALDSVLPSS